MATSCWLARCWLHGGEMATTEVMAAICKMEASWRSNVTARWKQVGVVGTFILGHETGTMEERIQGQDCLYSQSAYVTKLTG